MRRAKIVATLGPALDDPDKLRAAVEAGIDVVRLNFSHGDHETHARRLEAVRELADRLGRNVGALADLQGPKIRLGILPKEGVALPTGSEVFLIPGREDLDDYASDGQAALPVVYEELAGDVHPGSLVLIDDGDIRLVVSRREADGVRAKVVSGGVALSRKGVNLPGVAVSAPSLTEKDRRDLKFAVELGVDWIALSFVRRPEDIHAARGAVAAFGGEAPIIAKMERPEAIDHLAAVVAASDAVMVARGDLGVEIGPERVPAIQKEIIAEANAEGRPVITATEMLGAMITSPRPTRAEASDVANAIFDGTDAVMLSGETASGAYPVEAVRTMARIIEVAERSPHLLHPPPPPQSALSIGRVVSQAACRSRRTWARSRSPCTRCRAARSRTSARTARACPSLGMTTSEKARRRTALMWGAEAVLVP